jgi:hypothetical protein
LLYPTTIQGIMQVFFLFFSTPFSAFLMYFGTIYGTTKFRGGKTLTLAKKHPPGHLWIMSS